MNETLDTLREIIAILQCAEDAAEDPVKTTLGVVNGLLLGVKDSLEHLGNEYHAAHENQTIDKLTMQ